MLKKIASFTLAAAIFIVPAYAQTASIQAPTTQSAEGSRYVSVLLTPAVLNAANAGLADLRVKNSKGVDVPYFIDEGEDELAQNAVSYPMQLLNAYMKDDKYYMDYKLSLEKYGDVLATSLVLSTESTNFAKDITLYGSYDNEHWEKALESVIYNVDGKTNLDIPFPSVQKYTHYRIELANNLEKIAFQDVSLKYNQAMLQEGRSLLEECTPSFTVEELEKATLLHINGLKNLELAYIKIETAGTWKRMVTTPFGDTKELYNLSFEDIAYNDTTLLFEHEASRENVFTIKINNHDDKPISITGVNVGYYTKDIVFAAGEETSFTLHFGENSSATAPVYDIASYKEQTLNGKVESLQLGAIVETPQPKPAKTVNYTLIFNIVILAVGVLLAVLILIKLRKTKNYPATLTKCRPKGNASLSL